MSKQDLAGNYTTIMDSDTVELFHRDDFLPSSWLSFIHEKRAKHAHLKARFTRILYILFSSFFVVATFCLFSSVFLAYSATPEDVEVIFPLLDQCQVLTPNKRVDCNPDLPISKDVCLKRGCCWSPIGVNPTPGITTNVLPPLGVPYCYYGANYVGYQVTESRSDSQQTVIKLIRVQPSGFEDDVTDLTVVIDELSPSVMRIKLVDTQTKRYEVPIPTLNLPGADREIPKQYKIQLFSDNNTLAIYRTETGERIFHVNLAQIVYSNQFLQLTVDLPSDFIYGIGEHREPFRKETEWKRYTLFNRDQWPVPNAALYGSHPFYLTTEPKSTNAHGVFLFNSNAMDIITQPTPALTYRTIGGIFDFFLFLGPTPEEVVQQYHQLIGLPIMPPMWSLGFHLSRFGYRNLSNLKSVYERTKAANIPYDVQWTDIDIFQSNNDFTLDEKNFKDLPDFIRNELHAHGMRFIPMFDCGISAGENPPSSYSPYQEGLEMNVFVKNSTDQPFVGKVWNSKSTVWPDFTHPNATKYWTQQFTRYHKKVPFDGAWIDMNEPSNFLDGQSHGCPVDKMETPRYTPGMVDNQLTLAHKTMCMTAKQSLGLHYNLHNLYGLTNAIATNRALQATLNLRPFIISRSTAPGHGHYASHWSGDIISDWQSMKWSIASILNFNLFGIPMVGADICGFNGNTTEELCARWHQLGAFYTFARNHNTDDGIDQDPVALGARVTKAARFSLLARYELLPYLYTLFYNVHVNGGTVIRPMLFEFPTDSIAAKVETQFMWGPSLLIAPALAPELEKMKIYFPAGKWCHVTNYRWIKSSGEFLDEEVPFDFPNIYYRAGSIIPTQDANTTIELTKSSNIHLVAILDNATADAQGQLYWDSGDGLDTDQKKLYNYYTFSIQNGNLKIQSVHLGYNTTLQVDTLDVIGVEKSPDKVIVNGKAVDFVYDQEFGALIFEELTLSLYSKSGTITHQIEWTFAHL